MAEGQRVDEPENVRLEAVAWIGVLGVGFFIAAVGALHLLQPEYDPRVRYVSEYALGPYGWLMTIAFLALAVASFAIATGLGRGIATARMDRIGAALVAVFGVCFVLVAIFPTDPPGIPPTTSRAIHAFASLVGFISLALAIFLNARAFRTEDRGRNHSRITALMGVAFVGALIGFFASIGSGSDGITQRIYIGIAVLWLLLTTIRIRSIVGS